MQYHALSLAQAKARVYLVGYRGERCVPAVEAEAITQVLLTPDLLPRPRSRPLYLLYAPAKAVLQLVQLMYTLLVVLPAPTTLLLQTPPAIPTLAAAWLMRLLRGVTVVVDWHNMGFSVLQHSLRAGHPFVRLSRMYERLFARRLDGHLCVTKAMARWLSDEWGVVARVLHDRPPAFFRRLALEERHALLRRLAPQFVDAAGAPLWPAEGEAGSPWSGGCTPWTSVDASGVASEAAGRPALLISSTSWTADEDFGMMLEALNALDKGLRPPAHTPPGPALSQLRVVAVITGKGPLKEMYRARMRQMAMRHVAVCTMWLEPSDYPALLGSADL